MSHTSEFVLRAFLIGVGATVVMDLWALLLKQLGIPSLNLAFLGRWIGHLPHGQWTHESIAKAATVKAELWMGWFAHYSIGVIFAVLSLVVYGLEWARKPTLLPAFIIGMVTVAAPLFILQPALGAGIASSKTPKPVFNCIKSLTTHTVFGLGLYLAALATASLIPAAPLAAQSKAAVTISTQGFSQAALLPCSLNKSYKALTIGRLKTNALTVSLIKVIGGACMSDAAKSMENGNDARSASKRWIVVENLGHRSTCRAAQKSASRTSTENRSVTKGRGGSDLLEARFRFRDNSPRDLSVI